MWPPFPWAPQPSNNPSGGLVPRVPPETGPPINLPARPLGPDGYPIPSQLPPNAIYFGGGLWVVIDRTTDTVTEYFWDGTIIVLTDNGPIRMPGTGVVMEEDPPQGPNPEIPPWDPLCERWYQLDRAMQDVILAGLNMSEEGFRQACLRNGKPVDEGLPPLGEETGVPEPGTEPLPPWITDPSAPRPGDPMAPRPSPITPTPPPVGRTPPPQSTPPRQQPELPPSIFNPAGNAPNIPGGVGGSIVGGIAGLAPAIVETGELILGGLTSCQAGIAQGQRMFGPPPGGQSLANNAVQTSLFNHSAADDLKNKAKGKHLPPKCAAWLAVLLSKLDSYMATYDQGVDALVQCRDNAAAYSCGALYDQGNTTVGDRWFAGLGGAYGMLAYCQAIADAMQNTQQLISNVMNQINRLLNNPNCTNCPPGWIVSADGQCHPPTS